jgi:RNA polymerase sigma-70 factor (ECF subfamily)
MPYSKASATAVAASRQEPDQSEKPDRREEPSLVERCVAGESVAWKLLYYDYFPIVQTFLRRLGTPQNDMDDLIQEVFLGTFKSIKSFRGDADFKTWLYRLCVTASSRRRRKGKIQEAILFLVGREKAAPQIEELSATPDLEVRMVEKALESLGHGERAVFVLYELEGVPGKRIAEVVGCPEATVWRRLHYARQTFKAQLEKLGALG